MLDKTKIIKQNLLHWAKETTMIEEAEFRKQIK
jgi:hypothetical protein